MISKAVFAVILAVSFTTGVAAVDEPEIATLKIGAKAPDFDLPGVDGKNWKLSDFDQSKILVVIFTCDHCPTHQEAGGRLQGQGRRLRGHLAE
jgi:peroxiredoxin